MSGEPITLLFPLADVLELAEHAAAAPEHAHAYDFGDQEPAVPSLIWVADTGTYICSNGRPLLPDPGGADGHQRAVFAHGWGPDSDRNALADTAVGGDDFAEEIPLRYGGSDLLAVLRQSAAEGWRWFVVDVGADGMQCGTAER